MGFKLLQGMAHCTAEGDNSSLRAPPNAALLGNSKECIYLHGMELLCGTFSAASLPSKVADAFMDYLQRTSSISAIHSLFSF
jgi:hypothetical protein